MKAQSPGHRPSSVPVLGHLLGVALLSLVSLAAPGCRSGDAVPSGDFAVSGNPPAPEDAPGPGVPGPSVPAGSKKSGLAELALAPGEALVGHSVVAFPEHDKFLTVAEVTPSATQVEAVLTLRDWKGEALRSRLIGRKLTAVERFSNGNLLVFSSRPAVIEVLDGESLETLAMYRVGHDMNPSGYHVTYPLRVMEAAFGFIDINDRWHFFDSLSRPFFNGKGLSVIEGQFALGSAGELLLAGTTGDDFLVSVWSAIGGDLCRLKAEKRLLPRPKKGNVDWKVERITRLPSGKIVIKANPSFYPSLPVDQAEFGSHLVVFESAQQLCDFARYEMNATKPLLIATKGVSYSLLPGKLHEAGGVLVLTGTPQKEPTQNLLSFVSLQTGEVLGAKALSEPVVFESAIQTQQGFVVVSTQTELQVFNSKTREIRKDPVVMPLKVTELSTGSVIVPSFDRDKVRIYRPDLSLAHEISFENTFKISTKTAGFGRREEWFPLDLGEGFFAVGSKEGRIKFIHEDGTSSSLDLKAPLVGQPKVLPSGDLALQVASQIVLVSPEFWSNAGALR